MICSSCGASKPYTSHFDITNASARVNDMLRTFPIPSAQSSVIFQMQLDIENDIRHYSLEVSQFRSRLLYLQQKQDLLVKHLEHLKSLSAPIRRLPVELLTRIFAICAAAGVRLSSGASQLWTSYELWESKFRPAGLEFALDLCLMRSQSRPLTLELHACELDDDQDDPMIRRAAEQCARWRHIIMHNLDGRSLPGLVGYGRSFPLLETLEISYFGDRDPGLQIFNSAPRLRSLKTTRLPSVEDLDSFAPCDQITELEVSCGFEFNVYEKLGNRFPNLKTMVYADVDHSNIPEPDEIPFRTLPYLTTLEFRLSDDNQISHERNLLEMIITNLTLPSLSTLTIINKVEVVSWIYKGIWPHQTSPPRIRPALRQRPHCFPQALLVELRLKEIYRKGYDFSQVEPRFQFPDIVTPRFLTALHLYNHGLALSSPLVPKLESPDFTVDRDLFDDELFWKMVASRWIPETEYTLTIGVNCLRSVSIFVLGGNLQKDVEERLRHLVQAGLKVSVRILT
ncbi:hypothetical protein D9758_017410 [Tetrapyrgos nigripes]|uniref:F-box domain-containing protein n=1 Tax=Tetrapyrgos nigripes TaxID=182062 RepID=A0A8H5C3M3_9AGAR|nr:hypothetical protein D9758_017410 [Tetrapyrgos nigripes]